jgi:hypothetical protein
MSITYYVIRIGMSKDSSTQNIPQEATRLKKLAKVTARYMEMEEFKDSDHHTGYFCYNCVYFMKPNHCVIVTDEGQDVYGKSSGEIAPHGICALWEPNKEEMR